MEGWVRVSYQKGNQLNLLYSLCARDCARDQRDKDMKDRVFTIGSSWTSMEDKCTNCQFSASQLEMG